MTVLRVAINFNLTSIFGVFSTYPYASCTIFVTAWQKKWVCANHTYFMSRFNSRSFYSQNNYRRAGSQWFMNSTPSTRFSYCLKSKETQLDRFIIIKFDLKYYLNIFRWYDLTYIHKYNFWLTISSKNVTTCFSCPLLFVSSTICSFNKSHFFASKHIFTMATKRRPVDIASEPYKQWMFLSAIYLHDS